MGHGPHHILPISFYRNRPIFYGLGCFSFFTGHLGMSHGDWLGLVPRFDLADGTCRVTAEFVRHNDSNQTYVSPAENEKAALERLGTASGVRGARLDVEDGAVVVQSA
jgi:hypothetical protein